MLLAELVAALIAGVLDKALSEFISGDTVDRVVLMRAIDSMLSRSPAGRQVDATTFLLISQVAGVAVNLWMLHSSDTTVLIPLFARNDNSPEFTLGAGSPIHLVYNKTNHYDILIPAGTFYPS